MFYLPSALFTDVVQGLMYGANQIQIRLDEDFINWMKWIFRFLKQIVLFTFSLMWTLAAISSQANANRFNSIYLIKVESHFS